MVTDFWRKSVKISIPTFIMCAGISQGWEDRNTDTRVNTIDDPSTSDTNLVNFGPATPEFCRHVCAGLSFARHFIIITTRHSPVAVVILFSM